MHSLGRRAIPILVLVVGLVSTLAAAFVLARAEMERQQLRFEGEANSAVAAIEARMLAQLTLLRGTAGFFNASRDVSREEFKAYVKRLRLEQYYPGVLGIGFAVYASDRAELDRIAEMQRRGMPAFRFWPEGEREHYSTIVYLEPMNRLNSAAIGFDMLSQSTRRAAMLKAWETGTLQMSGRVRLVQEIERVKQPGFLIYLPIYAEGDNSDVPLAQRELRGWVYSPLRAHDLFGAIFAEHELEGIIVQIFDQAIGSDLLLYESANPLRNPAHSVLRDLKIAGRGLVVRVSAAENFQENSPYQLPLIVAIAGAIITSLITALLIQQIRAAERVERQVAERTAELREANARMREEARAREEAEAQVRQMQKIESIGQLTGGIAHDFNNMLAVIIGNLDMAQRHFEKPKRVSRAIANARAGAEKAAVLTSRLLAFGRQQALKPTVLDVNALVDGMSELLRRTLSEEVRLETRLAPDLWTIFADAAQLENAILNVAINARDAMPEGGALTIATHCCRIDQQAASEEPGLESGDYVLIEIRDTGTGMTSEVAAKALEPFFTTKDIGKGSGLGLSQAYGFSKQSGGHLSLESRPGLGTTVRLYLPRHAEAGAVPMAAPAVSEEVPRGTRSETILVVEDDEQVREVTVEMLADLGYSVVSANSAQVALDALENQPQVTLLLTDVVMPDMNGRQLADRARELNPQLKVLFTTGYSRDAITHGGRLDVDVSLLQKPFSEARLARSVRDEIDR